MLTYLLIIALLIAAVSFAVAFALRANKKRAFFSGTFVLIVSGALYALFGAPYAVQMEQARRAELSAALPAIKALEEALAQRPDDARAWAALGEKYLEVNRYTAAAEAYRRATVLSNGHPAMILQYNKALIFAANGRVTDDAKTGLALLLKLEPGHPEARYFLALRALQDGDAETAMREMKSLYRGLPDGSPLKTAIDRQIGRN